MEHRQSAPPDFGLRRVEIDANGTQKGILTRGEQTLSLILSKALLFSDEDKITAP